MGLEPSCAVADTMLMSYVLDAASGRYGLCGETYFGN